MDTATQAASPTPTLIPRTGWPSVKRAGVAMAGDASDVEGPMDGSLRLPIKVTGLKPGEFVELKATAEYVVKWHCGPADLCGEIGCVPKSWGTTERAAEVTATATAGKDGIAALEVELAAAPPSESCPDHPSAPWATQWERWTKVWVTEGAHGLRLTPGTIDYGYTY
jgi:hypothetical protein